MWALSNIKMLFDTCIWVKLIFVNDLKSYDCSMLKIEMSAKTGTKQNKTANISTNTLHCLFGKEFVFFFYCMAFSYAYLLPPPFLRILFSSKDAEYEFLKSQISLKIRLWTPWHVVFFCNKAKYKKITQERLITHALVHRSSRSNSISVIMIIITIYFMKLIYSLSTDIKWLFSCCILRVGVRGQ